MPHKFFIIACEPSADLHGALLIEEIKKISPGTQFLGLGGPRMQAAGAELIQDMTVMSALGFTDVVRQYPKYLKIFNKAYDALLLFKPDAVITLDSPAFNLRFAKKVKKQFPFFYYISPQIWAWGWRRIAVIKEFVSKMFVILPFEKEMYDKAGVPCEFVGHPLIDETHSTEPRENLRRALELKTGDIAVGLCPGSRKKEVERILPNLLLAAAFLKMHKPECHFFLSRSPNIPSDFYEKFLKKSEVPVLAPRMSFENIVSAMDFAFVTSGTATLQTALLGTPFFLVYKASWLTYEIGKRLVKVDYLGLVNLLAGKKVVPEFIQNEMHPETMAHEAKILLETPALYEGMKTDFENVRTILGSGDASRRAAQAILNSL